jgi:hypothetical protein
MIINSAPQNEAILSNVGEIGEFRIRNSAKAFSILSSGLYANKVRAIVRELSCNAVDSHTAAGKQDTPFDVHLPNTLEPWFAIRDYGTGLSHEQVTNIYTTYFESTKTDSNDYIGALGLGSKSPFSYTDNFTVTAIKDGIKGIYTAFINESGVPSIAKMMDEASDEPSGVEVKFSVNDRWDFDKFRQEARQVYTYFKLRPVISGNSDFTFVNVEYETENIIPGVHCYKSASRSVAIMGNIAYPIDVPAADTNLGELRALLNGGLELHFAIGELDFQASREGLSYIPSTIESIKRKLEAVNAQLAVHIATEADAITNLWERADFLAKKRSNGLWSAAVNKYAIDTKLATLDTGRYGGVALFKLGVEDLAKKFNIALKGIQRTRGSKTCTTLKPNTDYDNKKDVNGQWVYLNMWSITCDVNAHFVINDTKIGAVERAKFHYRNQKDQTIHSQNVFVLEPADRTKDMKVKAFFKAICNPPVKNIFNASTLEKKVRADSGLGKNVTIMCLQERGSGGYYREKEMVWRDAGKSDSFDPATTFYYLPLSGFEVISKCGMSNVKEFYNDLKECGLTGLKTTIYGVRKGDIDVIKTKANWINIEDHIAKELAKPIDNKLVMSLVMQAVDNFNLMQYNSNIVYHIADSNSPYVKLVTQFNGFEKIRYSELSLKRLCQRYATGVTFNPEAQVQKFVDECATISKRYPLLQFLRSAPNEDVAEYVNLIDTQKGI